MMEMKSFTLNGAAVYLSFTNECLTWTFMDDQSVSVKSENIISCRQTHNDSDLEIVFVTCLKENRLQDKRITFTGPSESVSKLTKKIQDFLNRAGRPRNLLVFVNPMSGKKNGFKIYKKKVEPLFNLCGVTADVEVTKGTSDPTKILYSKDVSRYDGIVAMGGDGFYSDCMTGLILRQQADKNVDYHDPKVSLSPVNIPIGIIPAGTGNYIAQYLHGTKCMKTAVLKILLGSTVRTNSASIHEDGKLVAYSGLLLGFGLFGDMMNDCENFRWMGPARYNIIPLASLMTRRTIDVEVQYLSAEAGRTVNKKNKFSRQMSLPSQAALPKSKKLQRFLSTDMDRVICDVWQKINGRVYAVDTHPIDMVAKDGKLRPEFGSDSLTMTLTEKCSISKHITQLTKVKEEKTDCYDFDFVQRKKVYGFRVKLCNVGVMSDVNKGSYLTDKYYINCDGSAITLKHQEFEVRYHGKLVQLFGSIQNGNIS